MDKKPRKSRNDKGKKRGRMSIVNRVRISLAHLMKKYKPASETKAEVSKVTLKVPTTGTGTLDEDNDIITQMGKHFGI